MIQLHQDYLLFETAKGQIIPCSAELVAVELIGEAMSSVDSELVQEAAAAVLHYFKQDLGWTTVTVGEFSKALAEALQALGIRIESPDADAECNIRTFDLRQMASGCEKTFELSFFPMLRQELRANLSPTTPVLRFHGLRGCVKQLVGTKRWNHRCQALNDQIVEYLRACLATEAEVDSCGIVIR